MSTSIEGTSGQRVREGHGLRTLLGVLAVGQVVASVLVTRFGGEFITADRVGEPPIVPVGWAFSIWSLVLALSVGYAAWAWPVARPDRALRDRLAVPLAVVFAGFSAWLVAAELEPIWSTVVVFAVMLAGLLRAMSIALAHHTVIASWPRVGRWLLWALLGIYTGWSSMAIWVNLTTALAGSGAPITGVAGTVGQLAVLAGATATAVAIVRWTSGSLSYAAAVAWALGTAALGATQAGEPVLGIAAVIGLAVVVATLIERRVRSASWARLAHTPSHR